MVKIGDVYQKTGSRWSDELGNLVVIVFTNTFEIRYRYISIEIGAHDISGAWDLKSFNQEFTKVGYG
jgi:hypothetical protein